MRVFVRVRVFVCLFTHQVMCFASPSLVYLIIPASINFVRQYSSHIMHICLHIPVSLLSYVLCSLSFASAIFYTYILHSTSPPPPPPPSCIPAAVVVVVVTAWSPVHLLNLCFYLLILLPVSVVAFVLSLYLLFIPFV